LFEKDKTRIDLGTCSAFKYSDYDTGTKMLNMAQNKY